MKLKEFNADNCSGMSRRTKQPAFTIDMKTGCNRINRSAVELLSLKDGDHVVFHQDEEDPENWYLEKVKSGGFQLRANNGYALIFNSSQLSKTIADSVEFTGRSGKCLIAGKPTEFQKRKLFGILTGTLKNAV